MEKIKYNPKPTLRKDQYNNKPLVTQIIKNEEAIINIKNERGNIIKNFVAINFNIQKWTNLF